MHTMLKKILNILFTRRRKPAESLIEVIIAVFVVATGSAAATTLIVSSMRANVFSRDNLIALNLAVEGIEGVRNIRDTNWIKFGYDKTNCWNVQPGLGTGADCTLPANKIVDGVHSIDLDSDNYSWGLTRVGDFGDSLDLNDPLKTSTNEQYRLGFIDVTPLDDTDGDGTADNDEDLYVTEDAISSGQTGTSKFYRMITITYPTPDPATDDAIMVVSTVQWIQQGLHQVELSTTLTNYQKVPLGP